MVDWSTAIAVGGSADERLVLEFANAELLELRALDKRLDGDLERASRALSRPRRWVFGRADLRQVAKLQVDSAMLYESVNNAVSLLGDQWLAEVYALIAERYDLDKWQASVAHKLASLESIYEKVADASSVRRSELLELIIIALIALEIRGAACSPACARRSRGGSASAHRRPLRCGRVRAGEASTTALYIAMGRAVAHAQGRVRGFSDPIAMQLLPPGERRLVERLLSGERPGPGDRARLSFLRRVVPMISLRTIAIDEAIRAAAPVRQLAILGAGLDARAFRMEELRGAVVFEVDHPATQAVKRERSAGLRPAARELRFVAVDFQRDALDEALAGAGQDAKVPRSSSGRRRPVSDAAAIESTLDAIARRAAPGGRLALNYTAGGGRLRWLQNLVLRAVGEPIRSAHTPETFAARLSARGFAVVSDQGFDAWADRDGLPLRSAGRGRRAERRRILVAERTPAAATRPPPAPAPTVEGTGDGGTVHAARGPRDA